MDAAGNCEISGRGAPNSQERFVERFDTALPLLTRKRKGLNMTEGFDITVTLHLDVRRLDDKLIALTSPVVPGLYVACHGYDEGAVGVQKLIDQLTEFHRTNAAVKAEREACAKIADDHLNKLIDDQAFEIANAIRARGET